MFDYEHKYGIIKSKFLRTVKHLMEIKNLTKRQQMIFDFIKNEVELKGYPPSVREIAKAVGLASSSTVHGHLARIEEKGYIRRDATKPRAIEVLNPDENDDVYKDPARYTPVIGKVTAGSPITAIQNIEEYVPIPSSMSHTDDNTFILVIDGDSMKDVGILDGDRVIVKQQNFANNGDIVVAMTEDDEATVKRFFKEEDHIRLQPENDLHEPIRLNHVMILGKVVGLYRHFH